MTEKIFLKNKKNLKEKFVFSRPGNYLVFIENTDGELNFEITAEGVNLNILGLFIGRKDQVFKLKTKQHHFIGNSQSNLLVKGVFYDNAHFFYEGLIRIEKIAQKSKAYQKNQNLLLSKFAFVDTRPYLEILANDVFCTHGSTTGRLNQESIFYLKTRGISTKKAKNLLVDGFINEIYQLLDDLS